MQTVREVWGAGTEGTGRLQHVQTVREVWGAATEGTRRLQHVQTVREVWGAAREAVTDETSATRPDSALTADRRDRPE